MKFYISMVDDQDTHSKVDDNLPTLLCTVFIHRGMRLKQLREELQGAMGEVEVRLIELGKIGVVV